MKEKTTNLLHNVYPYNVYQKMVEVANVMNKEGFHEPISIDFLLDQMSTVLTEREEGVLEMRYKENKTLQEVGEHYGVTRERIRQIELKALRKIRNPRVLNKIKCVSKEKYQNISEENKKLHIEILKLKKQLGQSFNEDELEKYRRSDISIYELEFSVRTTNCILRAGIKSLDDLVERYNSIEGLFTVRNLGRKSYKEVEDKLLELGEIKERRIVSETKRPVISDDLLDRTSWDSESLDRLMLHVERAENYIDKLERRIKCYE